MFCIHHAMELNQRFSKQFISIKHLGNVLFFSKQSHDYITDQNFTIMMSAVWRTWRWTRI